jgi:hypothetical protein
MNINLKYTSLEVSKKAEPVGHVEINNNSSITSVESVEGKVAVGFSFTSIYEPNVGAIKITGKLTIDDSPENMERAVKEWEASGRKNLPADIAENIHNSIIFNCVTEAVILAREIQLPPPMPMPHITITDKLKQHEETGNYIR